MTEPTHLADDDLLRRMDSGDEAAFTTLYRRRHPAVYRFALQMSGSPSLAEEVTQEVFMTLLSHRASYDGSKGPLAAYLYGIARRQVWRRLALRRRQLPIPAPEDEDARTPESLIAHSQVERDLVRDEAVRGLRRAILALPARYREAVVLCDLHELTYVDAARVMGCAVGSVRSRLHRARALLSERMASRKSSSSGCLV
ncbi:MAG: RNA polymerase sigma factor [Acidobacteriia bacterium]|nr:RNA polymerase sigma factor [Terriglobia bacterium]